MGCTAVCSCHAAQASTGKFQKTFSKTFGTSCRPRLCMVGGQYYVAPNSIYLEGVRQSSNQKMNYDGSIKRGRRVSLASERSRGVNGRWVFFTSSIHPTIFSLHPSIFFSLTWERSGRRRTCSISPRPTSSLPPPTRATS